MTSHVLVVLMPASIIGMFFPRLGFAALALSGLLTIIF